MYTIKLSAGQEIKGLKWQNNRFWASEDYRPVMGREQLAKITVSTDEQIITNPEDENYTGGFFMPGDYEDMAFYDYRKSGGDRRGAWRFYIAKVRAEQRN